PLRRLAQAKPRLRLDLVAAAIASAHGRGLRLGEQGQPEPLGQVEVVLVERVLGAYPAPRHTGPAERAPGAIRSLAVEVRVRDLLPRLAKVDSDVGRAEVRLAPEVLGDLSQHLVAALQARVGCRPQHALRRPVVWPELGL